MTHTSGCRWEKSTHIDDTHPWHWCVVKCSDKVGLKGYQNHLLKMGNNNICKFLKKIVMFIV